MTSLCRRERSISRHRGWVSLALHDLDLCMRMEGTTTHTDRHGSPRTPSPPFVPTHNSLYSKGRLLGYKRGKRTQTNHTSLIRIEGVRTPDAAKYYLGKRLAYVYRASKAINGSNVRVIWGKVCAAAGMLVIVFTHARICMGLQGRVLLRRALSLTRCPSPSLLHARLPVPVLLAGHTAPWQQRCRARQVPEQPARKDHWCHRARGTFALGL